MARAAFAFHQQMGFKMRLHLTRRSGAALLLGSFLSVMIAPAPVAQAETAQPIKLAVFDIELDDFTAGGPIAGESPEETARLKRMTMLARRLLADSGLFQLVDMSAAKDQRMTDHWLRKCNGCEADLARDVKADMSFLCFFRKVSVMEQYLEFRIRDAQTGALVNVSQTDLRNETDESWSRALKFLIKYQLVEPELARRQRLTSR